MLLGALCFILIYGPYVINPFYDGWIMTATDRDLAQHYLGFCLYRSSPWKFPLGLITTASFPYDMSVIYTDSIPLFAFVFKLLDPILPQVFQYLGIYGMISMSLMGGMGGLLIYHFTHRRDISVIASVLYTLSWTVLFRMFYHTSLTSQWLILVAIYLWVTIEPAVDVRHNLLKYALLSGIAILIHPYLWMMCGGIIFMSQAEYFIRTHDTRKAAIYMGIFCFVGIALLYIFGGFVGDTNANLGIGTYEANLNSLYNSMGLALLPGFSVALAQYEGFGYLGAGILFLLIVATGILLVNHRLPKLGIRRIMICITAILFMLFSILPEVSFNEKVLLDLNLGRVYRAFAGIFRSNGRFIWPVAFLIMTAAIVFVTRRVRKRTLKALMVFILVIQIVDMMPYLKDRHAMYAVPDKVYDDPLEESELMNKASEGRKHLVMDLEENVGLDQSQAVSYYAYKHDMTTNDFYYARPIDYKVESMRQSLKSDMENGDYDDSLLYIIGDDKLPDYKGYDLYFYDLNGRYLAVHDRIEGFDGVNK
jgi:hypothetical protein